MGRTKVSQLCLGRHFTIVSDHQPLTSIFHSKKGIPVITAARLQRYALLWSAHDYSIEYRSTTKHGNADGLSRLPLPALAESDEDYAECFYFEQFQTLPVTAVQISRGNSQRQSFVPCFRCGFKWKLSPYAEISLVARSRSSLTSRTTWYSETALEVVIQVSLLVRLASLTS